RRVEPADPVELPRPPGRRLDRPGPGAPGDLRGLTPRNGLRGNGSGAERSGGRAVRRQGKPIGAVWPAEIADVEEVDRARPAARSGDWGGHRASPPAAFRW